MEVLISGFMDGLKPEPVLTVTEWANLHRRLSSKGSAEPGPYRSDRTPFLEEVMDALSPRSGVEEVIGMKASQLGWTEAAFNMIGYYMDWVPCPIIYLMPTLETMERNVKQRIDPMIEECPRLREKVGKKRSRDGGNTLGQKDFPAGSLFLLGANSASALASIPARVAALDEVDRYPQDVDDEGSPISLVKRRMMTFGALKKLFMLGTPTNEGASVIANEFEKTDQRYYYIPCPHCYDKAVSKKKEVPLQILVFEQLRWKPGEYHDVHYECVHCSGKIYNKHKTWFLRNKRMGGIAEWRVTKPENLNPKVRGYHLGGLYSPDGWLDWAEVAKDWDASEGDEPRRKALINTILGLTYRQRGEAPPWQMLFERAGIDGHERNLVWESVAFITAGADVQANRIEVEIVGWMKGRSSQQIDYRVLDGDTKMPDVWEQLGRLLDEEWPMQSGATGRGANGRMLPIRLMAVDANFNSPFVHDFARKHGTKRVIPIQGRENLQAPYGPPKMLTKTKLGKNLPKGKVWPVGSSYLKDQLYGWLRLTVNKEDGTIPRGYCHFLPLPEHYFRGITAEDCVPVRKKRTNTIKYEWQKRYERNEPLDCRVYALAAAYVVGFDRWDDKRWEKEAKPQTPKGASQGKGDVAKVEKTRLDEVVNDANGIARETDELSKKKKRGGGYWKRKM